MSMNDIGERIRELRKQKGLTLKDMNDRTKISVSFLSDIENGRSKPSLNRLKDIANALGTTTAYLMNEINAPRENQTSLTEKDEKDIAKELERVKKSIIENQDGLMFDGEPASEEALQSVLDALEFGMKQAKIINKKYTPNKYRK